MTRERPDTSTLAQLRRVKDSLALVDSPPTPASTVGNLNSFDDELALPTCVNCGYTQQGQIIDRCPECGLGWASRLRDPTPWSVEGPSLLSWAITALGVVSWDERLRIRTSLIPATPASRRFAMRCVILTAILFALVLASAVTTAGISPYLRIVGFLINLMMLAAIIGVTLFAGLTTLRYALKGIWRRRLIFIPSSLDYSTAWWPPLAMTLLALRWLCEAGRISVPFPIVGVTAILGGVLWAMWLWASVSESGHIERAGPRIFCAGLGCTMLGIWAVGFTFDAFSHTVNGALARSSAGVASAKTFLTGGPVAPSAGPRTYALVIDVIPSGDERMVLDSLTQLGAKADTLVMLRNEKATIDNIEKAFGNAAVAVRPQDQFIVYINGHGSPYGAGSIQIADGEITSQKLRRYLFGMSTNESFVIVDSCFGGKFIEQLRGVANAVVLATTDDQDVAFRYGLVPFWQALKDPASDRNHDDDITVKEAFWSAYRTMLKAGEDARRVLRTNTTNQREKRLLDTAGYVTPQLEALGTAKAEAFSVAIKKPATRPQ